MTPTDLLVSLCVLGMGQNGSAPSATPKLAIEARDGTLTSRVANGFELESLAKLGAIALRCEDFPVPEPPGMTRAERAEVRLADGDQLVAALGGGAGDQLQLDISGGARLTVEVDQLERILFRTRLEQGHAGAVEAPASGDRLYWARSGGLDRVDGTLEAFTDDGVSFESVLGKKTFPWREVAALFIESLGAKDAKVADRARRVTVDLVDGGRLHADLLGIRDQKAKLTWRGSELVLPLAAVRELSLDDGSVGFLSSQTPERAVEGWPADDELGMKWPYQIDRAVSGDALRAEGRAWSRGIGVHAPSRLEWALDGSWKQLRGSVAVDDSVLLLPYRGSVEFALYLDDKSEPFWKSGRVRGGDAAISFPTVPLAGVKRLALVVEMDERSFVADRADWLRMLLLR